MILPYRGKSMKGTFHEGDFLNIDTHASVKIQHGDVIAYRRLSKDGKIEEIVHRVIQISQGRLITRGDNNRRSDCYRVSQENVLGKVIAFERKGKVHHIRGGFRGLMLSQILFLIHNILYLISRTFKLSWWIYNTGKLIKCFYTPSLRKIQFVTEDGPLIKLFHGKRLIARWWPQQDRFECKKPYDLVIRREDLAQQAAASKSRI